MPLPPVVVRSRTSEYDQQLGGSFSSGSTSPQLAAPVLSHWANDMGCNEIHENHGLKSRGRIPRIPKEG